jgi:hypothetical protein
MQFAVIEWAQLVLGVSLSGAAYLQATVALGVVVGAWVFAARITLSRIVLVFISGRFTWRGCCGSGAYR